MRTRLLAACTLACVAPISLADSLRLGVYLQGSRIGQATYESREEPYEGRPAKRGESFMSMNTGMLGASLSVELRSTTWAEPSGRPIRMSFTTTSAGRTQQVEARFGVTHVDLEIESGGAKQRKRLEIPKDGQVVDDPLPLVLSAGPRSKAVYYVLRPDTASFSKSVVVNRGSATTTLGPRSVTGTLVEITDAMATLRVFVDSGGSLIKAEGPLGIEMVPEGVEMDPAVGMPDLANASSIKPDKPLVNPRTLSRLRIRLSNANLESLPSDRHQTAERDGEAWILDIHPERADSTPGLAIAEAASQAKSWTLPDTYMPSDDPKFVSLARQIVGDHKRVRDASLAVQRWVSRNMRANAGIGVLRDASEVLATKEGVCRDSAILAGTILRAAGIPTRLASGLVNWDGSFYYHAWVEVWDGNRWLGIDPTVPDCQLSASHVKLSQGSIEQAFRFPVLDKVSIQVLHAE